MKIRRRKHQLYQFFLQTAGLRRRRRGYTLTEFLVGTDRFELTEEDHAWLNMAPVGREFGSPDYERLSVMDDRVLEVHRELILGQWKRRVKKTALKRKSVA